MDRLFFIVIAVALAYGVGCLGRNRKIGFGWAFGISLINVIIGLIVVLCSEKKTPEELEEKRQPYPRTERLGCHRNLPII